MTRTARWGTGPLLALAMVLGGCSSGGSEASSDSSGTATVTAPEEKVVSAAVVASGLGEIKRLAAEATADPSSGQRVGDDIETAWKGIEGTVKTNDPDAYLVFEEGIDGIQQAAKDGNPAKVTTSAAGITTTVDAYLAAHPS